MVMHIPINVWACMLHVHDDVVSVVFINFYPHILMPYNIIKQSKLEYIQMIYNIVHGKILTICIVVMIRCSTECTASWVGVSIGSDNYSICSFFCYSYVALAFID